MAKFSDRYISNLKPREKEYQVRDAEGFALRVLPSGVKTFLYIYEVGGKRRKLNLGTYPEVPLAEAREAYTRAVRALAAGAPLEACSTGNPADSSEHTVVTVKDLQDHYLAYSRKDKQSEEWIYTKEKVMDLHLKDWHNRPIESITKAEAIKLLTSIQDSGLAGRNIYKVLSSLFEYAVIRDMLPVSPFYRLPKIIPNMGGTYKTRSLSEAEIVHVWGAVTTAKGSEYVKRILKLILVTGQRPGEVAGIHRSEIDGDWWTIPPERAKKGKRHHRVYLTDTAKSLIGDSEPGYIFPTTRKSIAPYVTKITVSQVVNVANSFGIPKWSPHDLRRTARTHMARIGIPDEHAEAVLNHAKKGMVQVYNQYMYDDEKKTALLRWEAELLRILGTAV